MQLYILEFNNCTGVLSLCDRPVLIQSIWSKIVNINGWELGSLYICNMCLLQDITQPLVS